MAFFFLPTQVMLEQIAELDIVLGKNSAKEESNLVSVWKNTAADCRRSSYKCTKMQLSSENWIIQILCRTTLEWTLKNLRYRVETFLLVYYLPTSFVRYAATWISYKKTTQQHCNNILEYRNFVQVFIHRVKMCPMICSAVLEAMREQWKH